MPLDICPECGAKLANGLCPRCLVKLAIEGDPLGQDQPTNADPDATQARNAGPDTLTSDATGEGTPAQTDPIIDRSPTPATTGEARTVDGRTGRLAPGTTVRYFGDYEIQKELGRGGMGVVYKARQVSLNRAVALKMIKAGVLADDAELQRFQNEAEAVALLDHAGIVPVYEVGDHDGQRYFSMKLVEGGNLAEQLASFKDNPRAAATLLAETAEAVHHAHMRGILHRDLKPANILIDAEGHPHVTDFGLAKRVEGDVEMTASGAILGTPAYMSPEQANGRRGTITTATDIYGLGAILYAMLTGKAPFGGDSVIETLDAVRTRQPELPTKLNARVPRDLETIALKCLEKDPRRRYTSAQALADDLHAWLGSRPIAARRVGPAERAWLWCKRRPAVAALTAAVVMAVVGGVGTVIAVQARANADLRAANARVRQRYDLAVDAIRTFHTGVSEDFLLKEDQFKGLRDRLLESANKFYGKLSALLGEETDFASRRALMQANYEVAELARRVGRMESALAAHRAVLAARESLAAEPEADQAMAVDVARSHLAVGYVLYSMGRNDEALESYQRTRAALAAAYGDPPEGEEARSVFAKAEFELGMVLAALGRRTEGLRSMEGARDLQSALAAAAPEDKVRQSALADSLDNIGVLLNQMGRRVEGMKSHRAAQVIFQRLTEADPSNTVLQHLLARTHTRMGVVLSDLGRHSEALKSFEASRAIQQPLARANPGVAVFQRLWAITHYNVGSAMLSTERPVQALGSLEAGRAIQLQLVEAHPDVPAYRSDLALSHHTIGNLLNRTGKPAEALRSYEAELAIRENLADDNPAITQYRDDLANSLWQVGWHLFITGMPREAVPYFSREETIRQKLVDDDPGPQFRNSLANCQTNNAHVLLRLGRLTEARARCERAVALQEGLIRDDPSAHLSRRRLAESLFLFGQVRNAEGDLVGASADLRRAIALLKTVPVLEGENVFMHAGCHAMLSTLSGRPGTGLSAEEREIEAGHAMTLLRRAASMGYRSLTAYRTETALDGLRDRDDFKLLMMDLAMPKEPFKK